MPHARTLPAEAQPVSANSAHLQVYTFAGPRAGNYTFTAYIANCYPGKVFRIVHSSDTVPKVSGPTCTWSVQVCERGRTHVMNVLRLSAKLSLTFVCSFAHHKPTFGYW